MDVIQKVQDLVAQCDEMLEKEDGRSHGREIILVTKHKATQTIEAFHLGELNDFGWAYNELMEYASDNGILIEDEE